MQLQDVCWFEGDAPHSLRYLTTWSPVGDAVWGKPSRYGLVGESMLLFELSVFEVAANSLCLLLVAWGVSCHSLLPPFQNTGKLSPNQGFKRLPWSQCSTTAIENGLIQENRGCSREASGEELSLAITILCTRVNPTKITMHGCKTLPGLRYEEELLEIIQLSNK